jgi:hypothetical protein
MAKHMKLDPPAPVAVPSAPQQPANILDELVVGFRSALNAAQQAVDMGDASPQVLREMASVGRVLISAIAEKRAQEKQRTMTAKNLPTALILEHARTLQAEALQSLVRDLIALGEDGSVLA